MILTTLLLMQGQVLAPAETGEEGRTALPNVFRIDDHVTLSGRVQMDFAWVDDENFGTRDGSELRRAWLGVAGNLAEGLDYKMEVDFAGFDAGGAAFRDAYVKFSQLPVGVVKVGHFKEPFSMNFLTSSKHITFTERADTFAPGWNTGVMLADGNDNLSWQAGAFWDAPGTGNIETDNDTAFTGRVVFRPYMENGGERLAHIGLALSLREAEGGAYTSGSMGGVHLLDGMVAGGSIAADDGLTLLGLEGAIQEGPIWGQFEFAQADGDDDSVSSWFLSGGYFLTGESRQYSASNAAWSGVTPNTPYGQNGNGAWEVAARVGMVDFSDATGPLSEEATLIALALNWYLTSQTRIGFDVYTADADALADDVMAAVIRFGFYF